MGSSSLNIGSTYRMGGGKFASMPSMFKSFDVLIYCTILLILLTIWSLVWMRRAMRLHLGRCELRSHVKFPSYPMRWQRKSMPTHRSVRDAREEAESGKENHVVLSLVSSWYRQWEPDHFLNFELSNSFESFKQVVS